MLFSIYPLLLNTFILDDFSQITKHSKERKEIFRHGTSTWQLNVYVYVLDVLLGRLYRDYYYYFLNIWTKDFYLHGTVCYLLLLRSTELFEWNINGISSWQSKGRTDLLNVFICIHFKIASKYKSFFFKLVLLVLRQASEINGPKYQFGVREEFENYVKGS